MQGSMLNLAFLQEKLQLCDEKSRINEYTEIKTCKNDLTLLK